MSFKIEAFQNRYLPPGSSRVDAILTVGADATVKAAGELVVGFVIDKSGSMSGSRIESVRAAVEAAIGMLDERASFFVVAFDGAAYVVAPLARATSENKRQAAVQVHELAAQGGTAMSTGLREARSIFSRTPDAIRQAIFLTDGKNEGERIQKVD